MDSYARTGTVLSSVHNLERYFFWTDISGDTEVHTFSHKHYKNLYIYKILVRFP